VIGTIVGLTVVLAAIGGFFVVDRIVDRLD